MKQLTQYLLLICLLFSSKFVFSTPQVLVQDSFQKIVNNRDGLIVLVWSLDCPPCIDELPTIRKFHVNNPDIDILMISADSKSDAKEVIQLMRKQQLDTLEHWIFNNPEDTSIRYSIDPTWYGELPRSYLYYQGNKIHQQSGRISLDTLNKWKKEIVNRQ